MSLTSSVIGLALLAGTTLAANLGQWGPTIEFPMVPVAAAVIPTTGKLLVWSAFRNDTFRINVNNVTQTATWDPETEVVTYREESEAQHDMFCPGISFDFNGGLLVTGGDTTAAASIYDGTTGLWAKEPRMVLGRGYQSSATMSDGRVFTIGGSWSGKRYLKNGEVWDGSSWTFLPGADVQPMLTNDNQGLYHSDNHAWLFGWKNATLFQAGPSKAMNWYYTVGNGSVSPAGTRNDADQMAGTPNMYDALAGKILCVGGSTDYKGSLATNAVQLVTIGEPGDQPTVQPLAGLQYARTFATSTILPDGSILVLGGQSFGMPFTDTNLTMKPEIWSPITQRWTSLADGPTPRVYHSTSMLLPNGSIFNGGGGLCGKCKKVSHYDGQLFTPPIFFQKDGVTPAVRPTITNVATTIGLGQTLQVTVDNKVNKAMTFSITRMGSNTHTANTDQRRVPLTIASRSKKNVYNLPIPNEPGMVLPGYWYLWAMNKGVPSVAKIIKITP